MCSKQVMLVLAKQPHQVLPTSPLGDAETKGRAVETGDEARHLSPVEKGTHLEKSSDFREPRGEKAVIGEETASNLLLVYKVNLFLEERNTVAAH